MYQVGDYIVYGKGKICMVDAVGPLGLSGFSPDKLYYTLSPIYTSETIFVPVDAPVFMRPVISRKEAIQLISQIPEIQEEMEIDFNMDRKKLPEYYENLIQSHNCEDLVQLIITLYAKSQDALQNGRKVCQTDQNYMKEAQEILHGELAIALDIPMEQVADYISQTVEKIEKSRDLNI